MEGQIPRKNNYTSISTKGKAVVDYFSVPYTSLQSIESFEILISSSVVHLACKDM